MPGVESGAVWRYSPEHRKPLHFHGHLELLLVKRGWAVERIGHRTHTVHAGQLIWHLPAVPHELVLASPDVDLRVLHAEPDLANAMCRERRARGRDWAGRGRGSPAGAAFSDWVRDLGWLAAGNPVVELGRSDVDRLLDDCETAFDEEPPRADPAPRLGRLLQNAWSASVANRDGSRGSSLVELALCLLLEDPSLDRPELCRLLDVSEGHLSRCFQKELGVSLVAQRARVRVARFVAHVEREGQSLLDAALSAGFGSYSQLHRTFCDLVLMSPAAYLRRGGRQRRAVLTRQP
jgi:AraC-like DNA-binding protein